MKNPRPGNQSEPSQCGANVVICSGKLCCASPECQTTRARGAIWRGGHSAHPRPVTQEKLVTEGLASSCGEEDRFSHDTSTSCFADLQLCLQLLSPHNPHKEATFLHLPRSCSGTGKWGRVGLSFSGIPKASECLQEAALQLCPKARWSQGLEVNQFG